MGCWDCSGEGNRLVRVGGGPDLRIWLEEREERGVWAVWSGFVGMRDVCWAWGRVVMFCGIIIHNSLVILRKSRALTHEAFIVITIGTL